EALKSRVERAAQEGRYQHALELGKQLHRHEPTPEHRELLLHIYLGRERQLHQQGYVRDAIQILDAAVELAGSDSGWLDRFAEELAACGEIRRALALASHYPGSVGFRRVLAKAADAALVKGPKGQELLPESTHEEFQLVLRVAGLLEAGQDEQ